MPGHRLQAAETPVPKFAVAGQYGRPGQDQFVGHVALVRDECQLTFGHMADVWHCSPPIIAGERTSTGSNEQFERCEIHAVSFLDDLSPDDVAGIETTLAEIDEQTQPASTRADALRQYVVHPPVDWVTDSATGRRRFRKFSCVGFILECYSDGAGIQLHDHEAANLPQVDLETLASAYGDHVRNERRRERYGISGGEPWRITLAGYVMHALNRPSEIVRNSAHVPNSVAEAEFPLQQPPHANHPSADSATESKAKKDSSATERQD